MTIGIPRALIYWKRAHFWENFFKSLGFKILLSPLTNKKIVEIGVKVSDPETCFSNKVYWGHLSWLDGRCDLIFVPRLKTKKMWSKNSLCEFGGIFEYCPKFFALPDLAKILVKTPILTETFDERKEKFEQSLKKLGRKLNKGDIEIKKAATITFSEEKKLKKKEKQDFLRKISLEKSKIILISHPYNLCDDYVNLRMKEKLEKLGTVPIFIDEIPLNSRIYANKNSRILKNNTRTGLPDIKFHWEFGKEIMEKIQEVLKYDITGAIEVSSFQCGCDAVLKEFVEEKFRSKKIPFLYILIDEHTGEAGLQTRLEAFIDTIA